MRIELPSSVLKGENKNNIMVSNVNLLLVQHNISFRFFKEQDFKVVSVLNRIVSIVLYNFIP